MACGRGMMGIGTLIIFIAVILVAAIAASVMITTSGSLQQRSLITGSQAEEGVSSGVEAISLMATDGDTGHDLEDFELIVKLQSGSSSMNLNHTLVLFDTPSTTQSLDYGGTVADGVQAADTRTYAVTYVKEGPNYDTDYLSRGDLIKIKFRCFDCTGSGDAGGVGENKQVRIKIIPLVGSTTPVEFTTPNAIKERRLTLWP